MAAPQPVAQDYGQPTLPIATAGWPISSVDLQILTKSDGWNQGPTERAVEYAEIAKTGANYVALAVPYDNLTKYTNYVTDARTAGFRVYHRSHWNAWEGDNGVGNIATSTSLTSTGTTATCVTSTPHGLNNGDTVSMNGMNETNYRGEFSVTVVNGTTFTYTMLGTATSPATGNIGWRFGKQTYLDHTYDFIVNNPTLFKAGDMFGMAVEANQAGNSGCQFFTNGSTTFNYTLYNQFQKDQVRYANAAFAAIGLTHQVHTWPISHGVSNLNLNGQTVNVGGSVSTGNSNGLGNSDIATYFAGRLSIDHYIDSSIIDGNTYYTDYNNDLNSFAAAFPCVAIAGGGLMLSEWGFHTQTDYGDGVQYGVYDKVVTALQSKAFVIGINFWNHLGQLSSSIWKDNSGTIIPGGRAAVIAVKRAFSTPNQALGLRSFLPTNLIGTGIQFNGAGDKLVFGDIITTPTVVTACMWIQITQTPGGSFEVPFGYGNSRWFFIFNGASTNLQFHIINPGGEQSSGQPSFTPSLNTWYFISGTYDPNGGSSNLTFRIYDKNGVLQGHSEATITGAIQAESGGLSIGYDNRRAIYTHIIADDARVYSRILTTAEQDALAVGSEPSQTGLQLRVPMDDSYLVPNSVVFDFSGNGNNGALVGGTYITGITKKFPVRTIAV